MRQGSLDEIGAFSVSMPDKKFMLPKLGANRGRIAIYELPFWRCIKFRVSAASFLICPTARQSLALEFGGKSASALTHQTSLHGHLHPRRFCLRVSQEPTPVVRRGPAFQHFSKHPIDIVVTLIGAFVSSSFTQAKTITLLGRGREK